VLLEGKYITAKGDILLKATMMKGKTECRMISCKFDHTKVNYDTMENKEKPSNW